MLMFAALYAAAVAIATVVLATSLFLVEDRQESSFKKYGVWSTFGRCAGICLGTTLGPFLVFAEDPAPVKDGALSNIPGVTPLWGLVAMAVWRDRHTGWRGHTRLEQPDDAGRCIRSQRACRQCPSSRDHRLREPGTA